jgi:hypothetical protein
MMKRILTSLILCSAMFLMFSILPAQAAVKHVEHPLVTCSGNGCNNLQASATGCNVGDKPVGALVYIYDGSFQLGNLQEYWSPTCSTNWVHMHNNSSHNSSATIALCVNGGSFYGISSSNVAYDSPMIYAPTTAARGNGSITDVNGTWNNSTSCN